MVPLNGDLNRLKVSPVKGRTSNTCHHGGGSGTKPPAKRSETFVTNLQRIPAAVMTSRHRSMACVDRAPRREMSARLDDCELWRVAEVELDQDSVVNDTEQGIPVFGTKLTLRTPRHSNKRVAF